VNHVATQRAALRGSVRIRSGGQLDVTKRTELSIRESVSSSDSGRHLDACLRGTVKLQRAHGGCLGDERR
jgi:hypothetical protein